MPTPTRHYEVVTTVPLPRAAVWHVLAHSDRLNRHVGLAPVEYGDLGSDVTGFFRSASATVGGIKMRWREYPFQWELEGRQSVVRIYDQGPIERFEGGIDLEDDGPNSTRVIAFADIAARGAWGRAIVPLISNTFLKKTLDFCHMYLNGENPDPQPRGPRPKKNIVNEPLLDRLALDLKKRPVEPRQVDALINYLKNAGDGEVAAIRPIQWAREEKLNNIEALRTCMHAVKTGILNLRWSMMCPNCRVAKNEATTLAGVENKVHCDLCGIDYDLNFDQYVELRFAVHPAVRRANSDVYCISGPFTAPHILVQKRIEPGQTIMVPLLDDTQKLRLRVLRANKCVAVNPDAGPVSRLVFDGENWNTTSAKGPFMIENTGAESIYVALEKVEWDKEAVTAAHATSLQEFRDMFSDEVLRPGREVSIENVTIFFSDLSNSTALYETIGDGPAFGRVGSHFNYLSLHIARNSGAVVKTMGDAVMAVFAAPEDAVRAALEIQSKFCEFRRSISKDDDFPLDLKIGLHHGPALVVNSNDRLDYFGRTVNVAARVASMAPKGHFLITGDLWEFSAVQRLLIESHADLSRQEMVFRGVEKSYALVRVKPD